MKKAILWRVHDKMDALWISCWFERDQTSSEGYTLRGRTTRGRKITVKPDENAEKFFMKVGNEEFETDLDGVFKILEDIK